MAAQGKVVNNQQHAGYWRWPGVDIAEAWLTPSWPSFSIVVSTPSRVNFCRPCSVSCHA